MSFELALLSVILIANLFLGILVLTKNPQDKASRSFAFLALGIALWGLFNYLCDHPIQSDLALLWNRLVFLMAFLQGGSLLYFALVFPTETLYLKWFRKWALYPLVFVLGGIAVFTDLIIKQVEFVSWGTNIISGILYPVFVVYMIVFSIGTFVILFLKYRHSHGLEKAQIKFIFYGLLLAGLIAITTNLIIPLITGTTETGKYGPYAMIILVGFTAYAIIKHHLMEVRVIATEVLVTGIIAILFIQVLLSKGWQDALLRGAFLILVIYFGYLLIQSVLREISQREQLEKLTTELKTANTRLKELDAMKSEFVSMASHELLTPISAIEGYLSMMLDEKLVKIDDPKAIQYMDRVYKSSRRLARLVADLLNVSRIEQGRLLVEKQVVEMAGLIDNVIKELKFKAEDARLTLSISSNVKAPAFAKATAGLQVYGDADKLKEVLINLAGNALKFTPPGGKVEVGVELWPTNKVVTSYEQMAGHVKTSRALPDEALQSSVNEKFREMVGEKQLVVSVKDTGIGLAEEDIGHLFQKFSRLGDWTTREVTGTGLGLYISKALAEMHHGRIWVESEGKGKGSTFYFSLPLAENKGEVERLDSQVPRAKDAKPLARMG